VCPIFRYTINNFGFDEEFQTFDLEYSQGNYTQKEQIQGTLFGAQNQFLILVQQAAETRAPCKVKISKVEGVWLQDEQRFRPIEMSIEFKNNNWEKKEREERQSSQQQANE